MRRLLPDVKHALEEELARLDVETPEALPTASRTGHYLELVRQMSAGRLQQLRREQLSLALLRIEQGSFGRCVDCSSIVEFDRLEADPCTSRCAACAKLWLANIQT